MPFNKNNDLVVFVLSCVKKLTFLYYLGACPTWERRLQFGCSGTFLASPLFMNTRFLTQIRAMGLQISHGERLCGIKPIVSTRQ